MQVVYVVWSQEDKVYQIRDHTKQEILASGMTTKQEAIKVAKEQLPDAIVMAMRWVQV